MNAPSLLFSFIGGLLSTLSPCVLPIIPIIVTGREDDSKLRPILIVIGLGITFVFMGIISTLFGQMIAPYIKSLEKIASIIIILIGVMFLLNINIFKKISLFSKINYNGNGIFSGLILGMTLGLIWIPCVGPVLGSILAMVASAHGLIDGIIALTVYTVGFSIPFLLAAYSAQLFRKNVNFLKKRSKSIGIISGIVLIMYGLYILIWGMVGIGI